MRISALFVAIAAGILTACNPSSDELPAKQEAAPEAQETSLNLSAFTAINGGTVTQTADGVEIVTDPRPGAMSAQLLLGPEARADGVTLRIRARVTTGEFSVVPTHANWPAGYRPYSTGVRAGDIVTVDVPVDREGETSVLIIGNGGTSNTPSRGTIYSVELVQGPSDLRD